MWMIYSKQRPVSVWLYHIHCCGVLLLASWAFVILKIIKIHFIVCGSYDLICSMQLSQNRLFFFFYQQTGDELLMDSPITVLSVETLTRMFTDCSELLARVMWCVFGNGQEFTIIYWIYSQIINNNFSKLPSYTCILNGIPCSRQHFCRLLKLILLITQTCRVGVCKGRAFVPRRYFCGTKHEGTGETDESTSSQRRRRGNYWWRRSKRRPLCRWFDPTNAWRPY